MKEEQGRKLRRRSFKKTGIYEEASCQRTKIKVETLEKKIKRT
jgi:hypothetical protein